MLEIKIKRIYDPFSSSDGFRILVDKLWPRGVRKEDAHIDLWEKDLAPSTELREWFHEDPEHRWDEFVERYEKELKNSTVILDFVNIIRCKGVVTLLFASKDLEKNNAIVLNKYLQKFSLNN